MAINITELTDIANSRLYEAEFLFSIGKYDAAIYLAGYAIELTLKARICKTLNWSEFPFTPNEFSKYELNSFKTHKLKNLLHLSGIENNILTNFNLDWEYVTSNWDPEYRYRKIGSVTNTQARGILDAVNNLITVL